MPRRIPAPVPLHRPRRRLGTVVVAVLVLAATALGGAPAHAAGGPSRCGRVTVIAVRGSFAAPGRGVGATPYVYAHGTGGTDPKAQGLIDALQSDPGAYVEALRYSAALLPRPGSAGYVASLEEGETALRGELDDLAASCPSTAVQLVGYSQGAHLIGDVLATPDRLSEAARVNLDGVVLLGDPAYRPGEAWDAPGDGDGAGLFERGAGAFDPWTRPSTETGSDISMVRSWCVAHDIVCQRGWSLAAHRSYANPTTQAAAAEFLRGLLAARRG